MEIYQKEALTIILALGDEDGEMTEEELKLEKRIREEFPIIDKGLKERERRNHFWEHEAEEDKRVIEAREKLNKTTSEYHSIALNEFMNLKREVYHELLETEETDQWGGHKYRAWDVKEKVMHKAGFLIDSDGTIFDNTLRDGEIESFSFGSGQIILIEYTGLKDKNGKEIYEGDIVRDCFEHPDKEDTCHYLGPSKKGKVVWAVDHAGFYIETDRWENDMYLAEITGPTTSHQIMPEWIEIIGNVFENPELVEPEQ